jgi:hypothetical protein
MRRVGNGVFLIIYSQNPGRERSFGIAIYS